MHALARACTWLHSKHTCTCHPLTCYKRCSFLLSKGFFFLFEVLLLSSSILSFVCNAFASSSRNWIWFCKRKHSSLNANIFSSFSAQSDKKQQQTAHKENYYFSRTFMFRARFVCLKYKLKAKNEHKKIAYRNERDGFFSAPEDYLQWWWFR